MSSLQDIRIAKGQGATINHAVRVGLERTLCGFECSEWKVVPGAKEPTCPRCIEKLQAVQR